MPYCMNQKCRLFSDQHIFSKGIDPVGSATPKVYLLGEAPGQVEDQRAVPFVGPAGELLHGVLKAKNVDYSLIRINNTVRCAPWSDKLGKIGTPTTEDVACCSQSVLDDIVRSRAPVIVTMGGVATKALLHSTAPITELRGSVHEIVLAGMKFVVIPTIHPSYIRRMGSDATLINFFSKDLSLALRIACGQEKASTSTSPAGRDYRVLQTVDEVSEFMAGACQAAEVDENFYITADIEAGWLFDYQLGNPMLGVGMSYKPFSAVFVPLDHYQSPLRPHTDEVAKALAPLSWLPVVNQNQKFDWQWLARRLGIYVSNLVFDTMLAHHCLWTGKVPNDLEAMAALYLNEPNWSYKMTEAVNQAKIEIVKNLKAANKAKDQELAKQLGLWLYYAKMGKGYPVIPLETIGTYCCCDADVTWRLVPVLRKMLVDAGLWQTYLSYYQEMSPIFAEMQFHGIKIDRAAVERLKTTIPGKQAEIELKINDSKYTKVALSLLGKEEGAKINLGSPVQVACLLYDSMKLPLARQGKRSKSSPRTTESAQLDHLIAYAQRKQKVKSLEMLESIQEWRTLDKYMSSYVTSNETLCDCAGFIHPVWNIIGTRTGRISAEDPPVHSAPAEGDIRTQYISRWADIGGVLLGADESQVEVRIFASLARDEYLIDFYNNKRGDLHRYLASLLFGKRIEDVTDAERRIAKTCVFASLYGGGAMNLAGQARIPFREAEAIHAKFVSLIMIDRFKQEEIAEMNANKGFITTPHGRHLWIEEGQTEGQVAHMERQLLNSPIQSTASDVVGQALKRAWRYMLQMKLRSRIILWHHDAIYWDVYPGELFTLLPLAKRVMVEEPMEMYKSWLRVPLKIGIAVGNNWSDEIEVDKFDASSFTIKFEANKKEETCYDRFEAEVASQFRTGAMGRSLQLHVESSQPREIVARVTSRSVTG